MNLPRIAAIQISVAAIAVAVTVGTLLYLGPLTEKVVSLRNEVTVLEAKRLELQKSNEALFATVKRTPTAQAAVEGFLYVGRLSSGGIWAPPSESVAPSPDASQTKGIDKLAIRKDAIIFGDIDPKPASQIKDSERRREPMQLVRAGTELPVLSIQTQPSIGAGTLVWARVRVPADRVLEIGQ